MFLKFKFYKKILEKAKITQHFMYIQAIAIIVLFTLNITIQTNNLFIDFTTYLTLQKQINYIISSPSSPERYWIQFTDCSWKSYDQNFHQQREFSLDFNVDKAWIQSNYLIFHNPTNLAFQIYNSQNLSYINSIYVQGEIKGMEVDSGYLFIFKQKNLFIVNYLSSNFNWTFFNFGSTMIKEVEFNSSTNFYFVLKNDQIYKGNCSFSSSNFNCSKTYLYTQNNVCLIDYIYYEQSMSYLFSINTSNYLNMYNLQFDTAVSPDSSLQFHNLLQIQIDTYKIFYFVYQNYIIYGNKTFQSNISSIQYVGQKNYTENLEYYELLFDSQIAYRKGYSKIYSIRRCPSNQHPSNSSSSCQPNYCDNTLCTYCPFNQNICFQCKNGSQFDDFNCFCPLNFSYNTLYEECVTFNCNQYINCNICSVSQCLQNYTLSNSGPIIQIIHCPEFTIRNNQNKCQKIFGYEPIRAASQTSRVINGIPHIRAIMKFMSPLFSFFDDYWYYNYHERDYQRLPYVNIFFTFLNNVNQQKMVPDISFIKQLQKISQMNSFQKSNYTLYTPATIFMISQSQIYYSQNTQSMFLWNYTGAIFMLILFKLIARLFLYIAKQFKSRDKKHQSISILQQIADYFYSRSIFHMLMISFFQGNMIFLSFTFFSQIKLSFSFCYLDKLNLLFGVCYTFFALTFTFAFYIFTPMYLSKYAELFLKDMKYKLKSFYLQTILISFKNMAYGFVQAFFLKSYILQVSLLALIKILLTTSSLYYFKCFNYKLTGIFTIAYFCLGIIFDLYLIVTYILDQNNKIPQDLTSSNSSHILQILCVFGSIILVLFRVILGIVYDLNSLMKQNKKVKENEEFKQKIQNIVQMQTFQKKLMSQQQVNENFANQIHPEENVKSSCILKYDLPINIKRKSKQKQETLDKIFLFKDKNNLNQNLRQKVSFNFQNSATQQKNQYDEKSKTSFYKYQIKVKQILKQKQQEPQFYEVKNKTNHDCLQIQTKNKIKLRKLKSNLQISNIKNQIKIVQKNSIDSDLKQQNQTNFMNINLNSVVQLDKT